MASAYRPPVMGTSHLVGSPSSNALSCDSETWGTFGDTQGTSAHFLGQLLSSRRTSAGPLGGPHDLVEGPRSLQRATVSSNCSGLRGQLLWVVEQIRTCWPHKEACFRQTSATL